MSGYALASLEQPAEVYRAGLNTTRLLMALGDLIIGWLLARQADVALAALDAGAGPGRGLLPGQGGHGAVLRRRPCCPGWPWSGTSPRRPAST